MREAEEDAELRDEILSGCGGWAIPPPIAKWKRDYFRFHPDGAWDDRKKKEEMRADKFYGVKKLRTPIVFVYASSYTAKTLWALHALVEGHDKKGLCVRIGGRERWPVATQSFDRRTYGLLCGDDVRDADFIESRQDGEELFQKIGFHLKIGFWMTFFQICPF